MHRSPTIHEYLLFTALVLPKMSLSHLENMPLNHSSPQGAQRSSWKLWLLCSTITFLLLCLFIILIFIFLPLKVRSLPCKFLIGPLPSKW
uniref:Uncharacterized protein n=1 Tax=Loxodonta africana TaxID=9785 RepID=G3TBU1_LOXAF